MPDKFENATLLLRLGLPSTLQRLYPHKKIRENGTFWKRSPEWNNLKTKLFCISVDGELFVSGTFRIRWRHFLMWFIFSSAFASLINFSCISRYLLWQGSINVLHFLSFVISWTIYRNKYASPTNQKSNSHYLFALCVLTFF